MDINLNNDPFLNGYYDTQQLLGFGFKSVGSNVKLAKNCIVVGSENISIGDNVIIDSFSALIASGPEDLIIGSYVHIGAYCFLLASEGIEIKDFSGLSQGVRIYSKSDDYSGNTLTNPLIPSKYKNVKRGKVNIDKHVIIGANSVVLPNLNIGRGAAIGALSLVSTNLSPWFIYNGNPLKKMAPR